GAIGVAPRPARSQSYAYCSTSSGPVCPVGPASSARWQVMTASPASESPPQSLATAGWTAAPPAMMATAIPSHGVRFTKAQLLAASSDHEPSEGGSRGFVSLV